MSDSFQKLTTQKLNKALAELLVPQLVEIIRDRKPGHCMRVADLDLQLILLVTKALHQRIKDAQVYVLSSSLTETDIARESNFYITSTKLVELRNVDNSSRSPLLIFLPANLHTNAEDSFNIASFEDIDLSDVYQRLAINLSRQLPSTLQGYVRDIFQELKKQNWAYINAVERAKFLLTAISNGNDGETIGAALYELGLVPDFALFDDTSLTLGKIVKNQKCVEEIITSSFSLRRRILELGITDLTVQNKLTNLLLNFGYESPQNWTSQIALNHDYWQLSFDKWNLTKKLI